MKALSNCIRLGIFGLGSVGEGFVKQLVKNRAKIEAACGKEIILYKACVKNPGRERNLPETELLLSSDPEFILSDDSVDVCLELIGGNDVALDVCLRCLSKGIPVITANKYMLAEQGDILRNAAAKNDTPLAYEASVCGGIPIIKIIRENFAGESISKIFGILNGTTNYILSSMASEGAEFSETLQKAQALGYAEADPGFDIDGIDAAHKLTIMMNLAFNRSFAFSSLSTTGIRGIQKADIKNIQNMGYRLKHIGWAFDAGNGRYEAALSMALLSQSHPLSGVNQSYNAVMFEGEFTGKTLFYGKGAGGGPTGNSVIADLIDVLCGRVIIPKTTEPSTIERSITTMLPYYVGLTVNDQIGVLAEITSIISHWGINVMRILQSTDESSRFGQARITVVTHKTSWERVQNALQMIRDKGLIHHVGCYPIFD